MQTAYKTTLHTRLKLARRAAQSAGDVILANYGKELNVQTKSSEVDLVTQVDIECDALIREILQEEAPEDTLITEESYQHGETIRLESAWIVDPLDGTTNYAHAFPHFAVSIAYVEQGEPKIGVIFDPLKNELFTAIAGEGAMRNGVPIHTNNTQEMGRALLATGFPYDIQSGDSRQNNLNLMSAFLERSHGIRRAGAAALDLAYVACGRLDGFWEMRLAPWDVAAGLLLMQEAGGVVTGFHGEKMDLSQRYINVIGANKPLHPQLLSVVRNVFG